jgi:hypothetical protein
MQRGDDLRFAGHLGVARRLGEAGEGKQPDRGREAESGDAFAHGFTDTYTTWSPFMDCW